MYKVKFTVAFKKSKNLFAIIVRAVLQLKTLKKVKVRKQRKK